MGAEKHIPAKEKNHAQTIAGPAAPNKRQVRRSAKL